MTKSRGILYGPDMVRANRADLKTQTRRPINRVATKGPVTEFGETTTEGYDFHFRDREMRWHDVREPWLLERCPYGPVGRLLYVRETWYSTPKMDHPGYKPELLGFKADGDHPRECTYRTMSSIHLPRRFSRDWLRVTAIRAERVQDITEEDAIAEGFQAHGGRVSGPLDPPEYDVATARDEFWAYLWELNGKRLSVTMKELDRLWVWAITYERTEAPA